MMPVSIETRLALTYIGGPTLQLELGGVRFMTDPTFDPGGTQHEPLHKLKGPAMPPQKVPPIDVVLLSHDQHAANLDDAGRVVARSAGRILTTPTAAKRLGGK